VLEDRAIQKRVPMGVATAHTVRFNLRGRDAEEVWALVRH